MQFLYVLFRSAWQWPMSQYESYKPARQLRNILAHTNTMKLSSATPKPSDHHISSQQCKTTEPFRNGWIRSQWGALRSWPSIWCGVPTSPATALNFGTGATDGSHGHGGKKHGGNWTPIDTHTHICIYMYIYVCLHIYVHIICICWSCPFLCVWMYVFLFNYPEMGSRIVSHAHININHITHVARLNHVSLGFPHGRWNNIGYLKPLAS